MAEYTKSALRDMARREALRAGVDPELFIRLVQQESSFNPNAVSAVGARGLAQLMPGTAAELGVEDSFDPVQNLRGGARYLRDRLDEFGDPTIALAAYNAGPGNVRKYGGVPPFEETREYVQKVGGGYKGTGYATADEDQRTDAAKRRQYAMGDADPGSPSEIIQAYQEGLITEDEFRGFLEDKKETDKVSLGDFMASMEALEQVGRAPEPTVVSSGAASFPNSRTNLLSARARSARPGSQGLDRFGLESLLNGNPLLGIR